MILIWRPSGLGTISDASVTSEASALVAQAMRDIRYLRESSVSRVKTKQQEKEGPAIILVDQLAVLLFSGPKQAAVRIEPPLPLQTTCGLLVRVIVNMLTVSAQLREVGMTTTAPVQKATTSTTITHAHGTTATSRDRLIHV
jgi:hypothetical protein